jgi:chemotaxis response regulator CheB
MMMMPAKDFPIVCVGGSAGGLDAYTRLLRHSPDDMGVAIVIVNHLRMVATRLHELLPCCTRMPVKLITEGLVIEPDVVFIIPAQRDLHRKRPRVPKCPPARSPAAASTSFCRPRESRRRS